MLSVSEYNEQWTKEYGLAKSYDWLDKFPLEKLNPVAKKALELAAEKQIAANKALNGSFVFYYKDLKSVLNTAYRKDTGKKPPVRQFFIADEVKEWANLSRLDPYLPFKSVSQSKVLGNELITWDSFQGIPPEVLLKAIQKYY